MVSYDLPYVAPHKLLLAMSASGTKRTLRAFYDRNLNGILRSRALFKHSAALIAQCSQLGHHAALRAPQFFWRWHTASFDPPCFH